MSQGQANPAIAELQGIVLFQSGQIAALHTQLMNFQQALAQTQQVLKNCEEVSSQRQALIEELKAQLYDATPRADEALQA